MAGTYKDWMPSSRTGQVDMSRKWVSVMSEDTKDAAGKTVQKWAAWGLPEATFTELGEAYGEAVAALELARNEDTRTKVTNRRCEKAFAALEALMRSIKNRYFFIPPLTEEDFIALGLKVHDKQLTPTGAPKAEMGIRFYYEGKAQVGIILEFLSGDPDDASNKLYRVYYKLLDPGEAPPREPEETWQSFSTKRKRELLEFKYTDSGKIAYFSVRIENGMKKGPWGPLASTAIP